MLIRCRYQGYAVHLEIQLCFGCFDGLSEYAAPSFSYEAVLMILVMTIPSHLLWRVRISTKKKLALFGIFSLVIITMIFAIVRTAVISSLTRQPDTSWSYMWSSIEQNVGMFNVSVIIVVCTFSNIQQQSSLAVLLLSVPCSQIPAGKQNKRTPLPLQADELPQRSQFH